MPNVSEEDLIRLVNEKNKQRAAMKREYFKLITNPHAHGGAILDPAFQRFASSKAYRIEHFRETPKNALRLFGFLILPFLGTYYYIKNDRDTKEASFRNGEVAYRDRLFKFV